MKLLVACVQRSSRLHWPFRADVYRPNINSSMVHASASLQCEGLADITRIFFKYNHRYVFVGYYNTRICIRTTDTQDAALK
jgi:hypothetical protein